MKEFSSAALLLAFGISGGLVVSVLISLVAGRFPRRLFFATCAVTVAVYFYDFELTNWPFFAGFTHSLIGGLWVCFVVWAIRYKERQGLKEADPNRDRRAEGADSDDHDVDSD